jgi:hypothetical protein
MYRVYRKLQEGRRQSVTLGCENPAELRGELWEVLEDRCKPTVTPQEPAILPAVTGSTANTAGVSTSQFYHTISQSVWFVQFALFGLFVMF